MPLSPDQLQSLSRWLDELMDLGPAEREAWLVRLPADQQDLADTLREMLKAQVSTGGENFLASLPELREQPAAKDSPDLAHPGDRVGPYRLIKEIGRGGMGAVWLAERADGNFKRQVALKLPRLAWGSGLAERMAREREIGAMLEHPNIARLYDAGVDELGRPYIAMEFIDGKTIDVYCRDRQLSVRDRLKLLVQVARAVAYAHGRLIVHRDLKPSNVLVSEDGQAHLLDFGIAKLLDEAALGQANLTQDQGRVLTPTYASPEQLKGEPVTVQTDVYGLGLLAFEVLTNALPYGSTGSKPTRGRELDQIILQGYLEPASRKAGDAATQRQLRGDLDAVLGKALKVEPQERYRSVDAMADDWQRWLENKPVSAQPDGWVYRLRMAARRHWVGLSVAMGAVSTLTVGVLVATSYASDAQEARTKEAAVRDFVGDLIRTSSVTDRVANDVPPATASEFVTQSAKKIETKFASQPALRADLYSAIGQIYSDMGVRVLAAEFGSRKLEALRATTPHWRVLAQTLLEVANASLNLKRPQAARLYAEEVLRIARADPDLVLRAEIAVARVLADQFQNEELVESIKLIETKIKQADRVPPDIAAWLLALKARSDGRKNRFDTARVLIAAAIERAIQTEGIDSLLAVEFRLLAANLSFDDRSSAALFEAAMATLARLGGDHQVRAAIERARYWANRYVNGSDLVSAPEVLGLLKTSRQVIAGVRRYVPGELFALLDADEASVNSVWGEVETAVLLYRHSAESVLSVVESPSERYLVAFGFAAALMHSGRHEESSQWFARARNSRLWPDDHPWNAAFHSERAYNLGMAGRLDEAHRLLEALPRYPDATDEASSPDIYNSMIQLMRSRLRRMSRDFDGAISMFPDQLLAPGSDPGFAMEAEADYGELLCETDQTRRGLEYLKRALLRRMAWQGGPKDSANAPWLMRLRSVAGLCAFRAGEVDEAVSLANEALKARTLQSAVSTYYLDPLNRLESTLGNRAASRRTK